VDNLNCYVLLIFAPILIAAGILGFVLPEERSLTSGAPAYNVFHMLFGVLGLAILVFSGTTPAVRVFNVGFGLIDLYQAGASFGGLWPKRRFRWKKADDILHVVIGLGLVLVGVFGT
jgi:hypothetical protein